MKDVDKHSYGKIVLAPFAEGSSNLEYNLEDYDIALFDFEDNGDLIFKFTQKRRRTTMNKPNDTPNTVRIDAAIEPLSRYFDIKLIGYNDEDGFIFRFKPKEVVDKADETC